MNQKSLDHLRNARDLISDPDKWIKGDYFLDGCRFCAVGAIREAGVDWESEFAVYLLREALPKRFQTKKVDRVQDHVTGFNDHHKTTHRMVLNAFDRAIEKAGA